jgi:hypothetical protein
MAMLRVSRWTSATAKLSVPESVVEHHLAAAAGRVAAAPTAAGPLDTKLPHALDDLEHATPEPAAHDTIDLARWVGGGDAS